MSTALLDVLRLETAVGPANPITNHSGAVSAAGWSSDAAGTATVGISRVGGLTYGEAGTVIRYTFNGGPTASVVRLYAPAFNAAPTAGATYAGASIRLRRSAGANGLVVALRVLFNPSATTAPISASSLTLNDTNIRRLAGIEAKLPADNTTARTYLEVQVPAGVTTYSLDVWQAAAVVTTSRAEANDVVFKAPGDTNINVLGNTVAIKASRGNSRTGVTDDIDPGQLTATIRDASLAPAVSRYTRPGYPVRLRALVDGTWRTVHTQRITKGEVDTPDKSAPTKLDVSLEAFDGVNALANTPAPFQSTGNYRQRLEAAVGAVRNVLVSDLDASVATPVQITPADSSSALEQIVRARDTAHGLAYIDADDQLRGNAANSLPSTAPAFIFTDVTLANSNAVEYIDLDRDYGTDELVNTLWVTRTNLTEPDGSKKYGPYVASESESEWGTRDDEVEVIDGEPAAHAVYFLTNATQPDDYVRSVTFTADPDKTANMRAAVLELYTAVEVRHLTHSGTYRVIGRDDTITATKWTVTYTLRRLEPTTNVPVTNPAAGANTGPDDLNPVTPPPAATHASRFRNVTQAIPTNAATTVSLNASEADHGDLAYDGTNRWFIVSRAGLYQLNGVVAFAANSTGYRIAFLNVNAVVRRQVTLGNAGTVAASVPVSAAVRLAAGDKVSLVAQHNAGADLDVIAGAGRTYLDITRLGD